MSRQTHSFLFLAFLVLVVSWLVLPSSVQAGELTTLLEEVKAHALGGASDLAIDSCSPPCEGLICCDNHVCVHTVLACGFYPIQLDSFRIEGSTESQMAGFATDGILAAEFGQEARLWFGELDGDDWRRRGVAPGHYQLVLREGATIDRVVVDVVGPDGDPVARLGGHFWVFSDALDSAGERAQWDHDPDSLTFLKCHDQRCVELTVDLPRFE